MRGRWVIAPVLVALAALACAKPATRTRGLTLVDDGPGATSAGPRRTWALVIGVGDYQAVGVADLEYPDDDARAVAAALADRRFGTGGVAAERMLMLVDGEVTLRFRLAQGAAGAAKLDVDFVN